MDSPFFVFLRLGFDHISDISGYDHMLFITALCAIYYIKQWKQLLVLVTAFTIGHSITLALATLNLVTINADLVEFLIPVTILLTSIVNIVPLVRYKKNLTEQRGEWYTKYALALGFGLIHGLGFSNFLRAMLGGEDHLFMPLLAFNIGLEAGQLVILLAILLVSTVMIRIVGLAQRDWGLLLSGATAGAACLMILEAL
ncbi:MAG: HupE/UreJ family protein [Rhodothermaceae bacterium]|nr:HupE/UreJ family protein [Rhodothermaceae bacterium]